MNNLHVYIRHPDAIPIELHARPNHSPPTEDQRQLGLICYSDHPVAAGTGVTVGVPNIAPGLAVPGRIHWCTPLESGFELGIDFDTPDASMRMRMLEQLCQIHQYRIQARRQHGRNLSETDAALEWIKRYAALFPQDDV